MPSGYLAHIARQAGRPTARGLSLPEGRSGPSTWAGTRSWLDSERVVVNVYQRYLGGSTPRAGLCPEGAMMRPNGRRAAVRNSGAFVTKICGRRAHGLPVHERPKPAGFPDGSHHFVALRRARERHPVQTAASVVGVKGAAEHGVQRLSRS